jgi:DNA modification methylase
MVVQILIGDVFEKLRSLPDKSIHCVVTSPPYWGLRDYGVDGQIGLEPTLGEHLEVMVNIFEEVKRVLRDDGTLWLNYGDCYATTPNGRKAADIENDDRCFRDKPFSTIQGVLKPKDLCMLPNRVAIALQEAGWYVRSEIIWSKPNPMPESVTDRPAGAHEKIFLLTKSPKYFYDAVAVRVPSSWDTLNAKMPDGWDTGPGAHGTIHRNGRSKGSFKRDNSKRAEAQHGQAYGTHRPDREDIDYSASGTRNLRNVWEVAPKPFRDAHFATFPPKLVEPCIKAGTSEKGVCGWCGAPYVRISEKSLVATQKAAKTNIVDDRDSMTENDQGSNRARDGHIPGMSTKTNTTGWKQSCTCENKSIARAMVLDPFGGAGTTALVADQLQRSATLIELNPEYAALAKNRIEANGGMLTHVFLDAAE